MICHEGSAREGEATAEAQGAVRLMTIHKSKGLEFPIVVLADAGREPRSVSESAYLLPELGFSFKLDDPSMLYRLSKWQDKQQGDAESLRLLYVALTRAKDKLLISGRRRVFANWVASAENPLTARVMVNRLWQHHFGTRGRVLSGPARLPARRGHHQSGMGTAFT